MIRTQHDHSIWNFHSRVNRTGDVARIHITRMRNHGTDYAVFFSIRVNESADRCYELPRIAWIELAGHRRLANHQYRLLCYRLRFMKILSTCYHDEFPMWTLPGWAVERL